jgi:hypothetical protein
VKGFVSAADLREIEGRRLVKFVDPVAEQEMRVAAPAVFGRQVGIILREIVCWKLDGLSRRLVPPVFVASEFVSYSMWLNM